MSGFNKYSCKIIVLGNALPILEIFCPKCPGTYYKTDTKL